MEKLVIGSVPSINAYGITDLIYQFRLNYGEDIYFDYNETANSDELKEKVEDGSYDLAFVFDPLGLPAKRGKRYHMSLMQDELMLVLPFTHPLAVRECADLKALVHENFLTLAGNNCSDKRFFSTCREEGFEPHIGYIGSSAYTILDLVRQGMGISLLTAKQVEMAGYQKQVSLVQLNPKLENELNLCYPIQDKTPITQAFIDYIKAAIKEKNGGQYEET